MLDTRYWPQLAAILKYDEAPYAVFSPHQVEKQCAMGERALCGQDLFVARLDMVLAGLMGEFGDDFFQGDIFPSRLTAAVDILTAARVFLQDAQAENKDQKNRVRLLAEEAHAVLRQWAQATACADGQTMLIAAEETVEIF